MRDTTETAIFDMTDLHYGKRTSSYDCDTFRRRMDQVGDRLYDAHKWFGAKCDKLVIFLLGDVNDGSMIYPTQAFHQDQANVEAQANELVLYLVPWLRRQKRIWGKVEIETVPGNHGRSGKFAHEAASWDVVAYRLLEARLAPYGITVGIGSGDDLFLRKVEVRGNSHLLYHGHGIKSYQSIPWYGIQQRMLRWNAGKIGGFSTMHSGHFHIKGDWSINSLRTLISGTMVTDDTWAREELGWDSDNHWWLHGTAEGHPITWQYAVDLVEGSPVAAV